MVTHSRGKRVASHPRERKLDDIRGLLKFGLNAELDLCWSDAFNSELASSPFLEPPPLTWYSSVYETFGQHFPVVLFIMLWFRRKHSRVTIQMKATKQYFPVVPFVMLIKLVLLSYL